MFARLFHSRVLVLQLRPSSLGAALFLLGVFCGQSLAQEKRILLRNETIATTRLDRQSLRAQTAEPPVSGLHLIQLSGAPSDGQRAELELMGVKLLRPVPDDAFVAELSETRLDLLRALDFVHWAGPYKPEHKTHPQVLRVAGLADNSAVRVTALLSTSATLRDTALLQRKFQLLTKYSKLPTGRILEGQILAKNLRQLAESKAVLWIEPAPNPKLVDAVAVEILGVDGEPNLPTYLDLGFNGEGVSVAVADSGLHLGEGEEMHPDLEGRVDAFFYYGALEDASDEHSHGTHVTGIIAGNGATGEVDENGYLYGLGVAPGVHIVAQRLFDGLGGYHAPPSYAAMTSDAVRAGAVIGSNSWGDETQGRYDVSAMEFDALVRDADPETPGDQPYILEFSAGNAGPGERTMYSPAVGKNVIATGASQNNRFDFFIYTSGQDAMADFSSRGPCDDGRIKPDITAPGTWIASLQSAAASDENAWAPISGNYMYQGGTSQAGPHASGAAAVFVQYYRETHSGATPSPALVKAALINSAVDMDNTLPPIESGTSPIPNNDEGWGRVDLYELLGGERSFDLTDQTHLLRTGETFEKRLVLASGDLPLKITLAYTDVPGFPPAIPALVNDLDLEVISPSGLVYRGNQFIDGESVPGAAGADSINNVEGVHVEFPERGEYIVRILGRRILEDARRDTATVDQDFALVFSGDVPFPGQGVLSMDRHAYGIPSTMQLKLIDFDLAGQSTATVALTSSLQTEPLPVQLRPQGNSGVFTGSVQIASAPVTGDGRLHVRHNDEIVASYSDASPNEIVTATARADNLPPSISAVGSTNRFGRQLVSWITDERSSGTVFYRTNGGAFLSRTNSLIGLSHEAEIAGLVPGVNYQYFIVATDEAGNFATNDNNGALFTFVARPPSTVLLVDAYTYTPDTEAPEIPVTEYTDALDRTGVSYEVWNVKAQRRSPGLEDLKPYVVVMWRINDSFYESSRTLGANDQKAISDYLAQGGSFFMSSMDLLTTIGPVAFRTNVLHVAEFQEDVGAEFIEGAEFESVTAGVEELQLDYSWYPVFELEPILPNIGPDLSDTMTLTTNAAPILVTSSGEVVGLKAPRLGQPEAGRVVFLSFPIDAVPMEGPGPNNRPGLLRRILSFLAPGLNGIGSIALDRTWYTTPANVIIEVADSDLAGRTNVTVECRAESTGVKIFADLSPTVFPGVFRGSITLVPTNQPAGPAALPIANGDVLIADYSDATAKVQATAGIDTDLPVISAFELTPDYEAAYVSWETDEFTDALIQFGESQILSRTAYHPGPRLAHELTLFPLLPDRTYYYQIVSRDEAGNTTIDDNDGKLYTFRTLKPLVPPWTDNLENGAPGWIVQDGEESLGTWKLGVPNNALATEAHSPTRAWGVNLEGAPNDYVSTFLISRAIDLTGGNQATLRFWHNYDFLGDATFELARLLVFTNNTTPNTLANYEEFTFGWEQEEFDLSPFIGKVIYLVWAYEMLDFSFEGNVHPGWMIDDVELVVTNVPRGTIQITNNIAEAGFMVSGPTLFEGSGRLLVRSNAVAGEYIVRYNSVPYYDAPPNQTNVLSANGAILFNGVYTFPDSNSNGISDHWEQEQFQEVSPTRTASTDTDRDGFTDAIEFRAGTNPTDPESLLELGSADVLSNNRVQLAWPSAAGKTYRILGSRDGVTWETFSSPIRATASGTSFTIPAPSGKAWFFKIELMP